MTTTLPSRVQVLTEQLHWRWRRVAGSRVAHLVPPNPGPGSRTACRRVPATSEALFDVPNGLLTTVELCRDCAGERR